MLPKGLSFDRAEYGQPSVFAQYGSWCSRGISGEFFRANGKPICGVCAERARNVLPRDSRAVFWQTISVGVLSAAGVSIAYLQLIRLSTSFGGGYGMGFGAIAAGYAIGRVMRAASKGAGGRRYQVAAALLVYAALVFALAVDLLGVNGVPVWAYPFLLLTPFANLLFERFQLGLLELFVVGIGVRWAWGLLKAPDLKITGPENC